VKRKRNLNAGAAFRSGTATATASSARARMRPSVVAPDLAAVAGGSPVQTEAVMVWLKVEEAIELELQAPGVFRYRLATVPGLVNVDISSGLSAKAALDRALLLEQEGLAQQLVQDCVAEAKATISTAPNVWPETESPTVWLTAEEAIALELQAPATIRYGLTGYPGMFNIDISSGLLARDAIDRALALGDEPSGAGAEQASAPAPWVRAP
jgi:hypothetical protein